MKISYRSSLRRRRILDLSLCDWGEDGNQVSCHLSLSSSREFRGAKPSVLRFRKASHSNRSPLIAESFLHSRVGVCTPEPPHEDRRGTAAPLHDHLSAFPSLSSSQRGPVATSNREHEKTEGLRESPRHDSVGRLLNHT